MKFVHHFSFEDIINVPPIIRNYINKIYHNIEWFMFFWCKSLILGSVEHREWRNMYKISLCKVSVWCWGVTSLFCTHHPASHTMWNICIKCDDNFLLSAAPSRIKSGKEFLDLCQYAKDEARQLASSFIILLVKLKGSTDSWH